jgi:hypothetical protein
MEEITDGTNLNRIVHRRTALLGGAYQYDWNAGDRGIGFHPATDFETVNIGKPDIEHNQVW